MPYIKISNEVGRIDDFRVLVRLLKDFKLTESIENIVEKGEIAHFEQFHLFPQCFPKAFVVKMRRYGGKD